MVRHTDSGKAIPAVFVKLVHVRIRRPRDRIGSCFLRWQVVGLQERFRPPPFVEFIPRTFALRYPVRPYFHPHLRPFVFLSTGFRDRAAYQEFATRHVNHFKFHRRAGNRLRKVLRGQIDFARDFRRRRHGGVVAGHRHGKGKQRDWQKERESLQHVG